VQVVTIKSDILQHDTLLLEENDTLEIIYNLYGTNGLLSFTIYNKSDKPLYVDWKRSAFIRGENRTVYWQDRAEILLVTEGYSIDWLRDFSTNRSYSYGVMHKPEQVSFIPPKTAISMARFRIDATIWNGDFTTQTVKNSYKKGEGFVLTKDFDNTNSPIAFRNFLTFSLKHDFSEEFYIDHSFWAGNITHMKKKQFNGPLIPVVENGFTLYDYSFPYQKPNLFFSPISTY
jgi:hypothetical protein